MDLARFWTILSSANWILVLLGGILHLGTVPISAARWRSVLGNFGIRTPFVELTRICFIGYFFNLFLPSAIGGDFFRAYYLAQRESCGMSTTITSTLVDRTAGFVAMILIGLTFSIIHPISVQGQPLVGILVLLASLLGGGLVVLFHSWTHKKIGRFLLWVGLTRLEKKVDLVSAGLRQLRSSAPAVALVIAASLSIQFLVIVAMWLAAQALSLHAPFQLFLIFIPLINLSVAIPITVNGVGLRESMYYLLFSELGVPVETAVTLSLMNLLIVAMTSIPGGVVYSLYKREEVITPVTEIEG